MKYTKQAERIMENGGSPADWYNSMSSGFYNFYEDVMGAVWRGLLDQGYYIESSARNGEGVVDIFVADEDGEPEGDAIETIDIGDEISMFFELVASGDYANTQAIANEFIKEYMEIINSGTRTPEVKGANNSPQSDCMFYTTAPSQKVSHIKESTLISTIQSYIPTPDIVITKFEYRPEISRPEKDWYGFCWKYTSSQNDATVKDIVMTAADKAIEELAARTGVNASVQKNLNSATENELTDNTQLGVEWDPNTFGVDGLLSADGDIVKVYDLILSDAENYESVDTYTESAKKALRKAAKAKGLNLDEIKDTEAMIDTIINEVDSIIAVQYEDGSWDFGTTSSRSGHTSFVHLQDSVEDLLDFWARGIIANYLNYVKDNNSEVNMNGVNSSRRSRYRR